MSRPELSIIIPEKRFKIIADTCRENGKTVVVITHNQALTAMADRIITVKSGTVVSMEKNEHIVDIADIEW